MRGQREIRNIFSPKKKRKSAKSEDPHRDFASLSNQDEEKMGDHRGAANRAHTQAKEKFERKLIQPGRIKFAAGEISAGVFSPSNSGFSPQLHGVGGYGILGGMRAGGATAATRDPVPLTRALDNGFIGAPFANNAFLEGIRQEFAPVKMHEYAAPRAAANPHNTINVTKEDPTLLTRARKTSKREISTIEHHSASEKKERASRVEQEGRDPQWHSYYEYQISLDKRKELQAPKRRSVSPALRAQIANRALSPRFCTAELAELELQRGRRRRRRAAGAEPGQDGPLAGEEPLAGRQQELERAHQRTAAQGLAPLPRHEEVAHGQLGRRRERLAQHDRAEREVRSAEGLHLLRQRPRAPDLPQPRKQAAVAAFAELGR